MFQRGVCCRGCQRQRTSQWQVQRENAIWIADCHQMMRSIDMGRPSLQAPWAQSGKPRQRHEATSSSHTSAPKGRKPPRPFRCVAQLSMRKIRPMRLLASARPLPLHQLSPQRPAGPTLNKSISLGKWRGEHWLLARLKNNFLSTLAAELVRGATETWPWIQLGCLQFQTSFPNCRRGEAGAAISVRMRPGVHDTCNGAMQNTPPTSYLFGH